MTESGKFESLVHYACWRCQDPTKLGATKLNKILWFTDATAFVNWGRPITEATYIKRQYGPVPGQMQATLARLKEDNKLAIREQDRYGFQMQLFFAIEPPDISCFTADEISLADYVIDTVCDEHTAASISELSHDAVWQLAEIGEEIPLYAVLASKAGEVTEETMAWARAEANRLGYMA